MSNQTPQEISESATRHVYENKKDIIEEYTNGYQRAELPTSFFMAGSPGAGKTEFATRIKAYFEKSSQEKDIVHIDPDKIRESLPGYEGHNSPLFQHAVSVAVDKLQDHVLDKGYNFILDGTFSDYEKAERNVKRSLKEGRNRVVAVFYLYQDPLKAWEVTQEREKQNKRFIPKEDFVDQLFNAYDTASRIKREFKDTVYLYVVKRDYETWDVKSFIKANSIDEHIKIGYSKKELIEKL